MVDCCRVLLCVGVRCWRLSLVDVRRCCVCLAFAVCCLLCVPVLVFGVCRVLCVVVGCWLLFGVGCCCVVLVGAVWC